MCLDHMQEIRQGLELELGSDWGGKKSALALFEESHMERQIAVRNSDSPVKY